MKRSRLATGIALLVLATGCASATQPALRAGDVELTRSELRDAVEQLGVEVGPIVDHEEFDPAVSLLSIDLQMDDRFADAGLELSAEDYAAFNVINGLAADFDPVDLPPLRRLDYDLTVKVTALSAFTGVDIADLVTELYADTEVDPRYGVMTSRGLVPPGVPVGP